MSKWRPSPECLYVIPDIHGRLDFLKKICDRILPLRTTGGINDRIVFLGDYIDRGDESPEVLDFIIKLKKKYKDQIVTLKGNHEELFLIGCGLNTGIINASNMENSYTIWIKNGGINTINSYLNLREMSVNPYLIKPYRIGQLVPKEHISFLRELEIYYETDNFIFVHGGCNPYIPLDEQDEKSIIWDRSLCYNVMSKIKNEEEITWNKTIITGHNGGLMKNNPLINDKFMMLDLNDDKRMLVVELYSCEAFMVKKKATRMIKFNLTETVFK